MIFIKTMLILITGLFVIGCSDQEKPLRVGIIPWIGYESIYQAKEFGWLDADVELVEGSIASDSFKRIISGEVDAAAMTIDDIILARSKGISLTVVAVLDISAGADILLSKIQITDLSQLKGKRIGCENSALASLILAKTLDKADLNEDDVSIVRVSPPEQSGAWEKDEIDLAITYEPFASSLIDKNAYHVLSSRDLPELIFDVLAIRTDRIKGRESAIRKLLQAHFRALGYFHENYKDTIYRIATREGVSPVAIERALRGVILPSKEANDIYLSENSRLFVSLNELNSLMQDKGFIAHKVTLENLVNKNYMKE